MSEDWEERSEAGRRLVEDALQRAISDLRGGLVTKFHIIFEFIDDDGDRELATMSTSDLMKWDVYGMLDYARESNLIDRALATKRSEDD